MFRITKNILPRGWRRYYLLTSRIRLAVCVCVFTIWTLFAANNTLCRIANRNIMQIRTTTSSPNWAIFGLFSKFVVRWVLVFDRKLICTAHGCTTIGDARVCYAEFSIQAIENNTKSLDQVRDLKNSWIF